MKKKLLKMMSVCVMSGLILTACTGNAQGTKESASNNDKTETAEGEVSEKKEEVKVPEEMTDEEIEEHKGGFSAGASVHDPSIVKDKDTYYIFGTHMESAVSKDLRNWKSFSSGVDKKNKLFSNLFDEPMEAFAFVGKNSDNWYSVWAPDVIYNKKMGKWVMYFSTSSTYKKSSICMAVADDIKGPYEYKTRLLDSGFNYKTSKETAFYDYHTKTELKNYLENSDYDNSKWPNCIDPTVFYDADGKMWMVYGSWSGGIFLLEIDEQTGLPIHPEQDDENGVDSYYGKHLIGGGHNSIEGPYIMYDETSGYYYLFVSYGELQAKGGYQIRLFRSKNVDGPYADVNNKTFGMVVDHSEFGLKMMGNYNFPSLAWTYMAPGHNSAFIDDDGKMYVVYHQRFDNNTEFHEPRVHQMFRNEENWLVAAPFATMGETLPEEGYEKELLNGTYYMVNHGTDIGSTIHEAAKVELDTSSGTLSGKMSGTFELKEGTPYVTFKSGDDEYKGVFIRMEDEAGNDVMCFTAAGSNNNKTIWGVHYYKTDDDAPKGEAEAEADASDGEKESDGQ